MLPCLSQTICYIHSLNCNKGLQMIRLDSKKNDTFECKNLELDHSGISDVHWKMIYLLAWLL